MVAVLVPTGNEIEFELTITPLTVTLLMVLVEDGSDTVRVTECFSVAPDWAVTSTVKVFVPVFRLSAPVTMKLELPAVVMASTLTAVVP